MQKFSVEFTEIDGLKIINPFSIEDERGNFIKYFERDIYSENGIEFNIFESFETTSKKGTIRGLHFQTNNPQAKLVRVSYGKILDVAVDLRKDSETFGKYHSLILSQENKKSFYIPKGFAHGFICLSDIAIVSYMCDGKYSSETDGGIIWNDNELNIDWKLSNMEKIIVSDKDKKLQSFEQFCENNPFTL